MVKHNDTSDEADAAEVTPDREESKILTFAEIIATDDLPTAIVPIPAWGGAVKVRGLSRAESDKAYADSTDRKGKVDTDEVSKRIVCWGSVEPKITWGNYDALTKKSAGAVQIIVNAIVDLSGLNPDAIDAARADFRQQS